MASVTEPPPRTSARRAAAAVARHRADGPEPDLDRAARAVIAATRPGDVLAYGGALVFIEGLKRAGL